MYAGGLNYTSNRGEDARGVIGDGGGGRVLLILALTGYDNNCSDKIKLIKSFVYDKLTHP